MTRSQPDIEIALPRFWNAPGVGRPMTIIPNSCSWYIDDAYGGCYTGDGVIFYPSCPAYFTMTRYWAPSVKSLSDAPGTEWPDNPADAWVIPTNKPLYEPQPDEGFYFYGPNGAGNYLPGWSTGGEYPTFGPQFPYTARVSQYIVSWAIGRGYFSENGYSVWPPHYVYDPIPDFVRVSFEFNVHWDPGHVYPWTTPGEVGPNYHGPLTVEIDVFRNGRDQPDWGVHSAVPYKAYYYDWYEPHGAISDPTYDQWGTPDYRRWVEFSFVVPKSVIDFDGTGLGGYLSWGICITPNDAATITADALAMGMGGIGGFMSISGWGMGVQVRNVTYEAFDYEYGETNPNVGIGWGCEFVMPDHGTFTLGSYCAAGSLSVYDRHGKQLVEGRDWRQSDNTYIHYTLLTQQYGHLTCCYLHQPSGMHVAANSPKLITPNKPADSLRLNGIRGV